MDFLKDLYGHQSWADAESWRALASVPAALEDARVRERLHHIHLVQRAFLWAVRGAAGRLERSAPGDFPSADALRRFAREASEAIAAHVRTLDAAALAARVRIPWFKDPPLELSVAEALTQAAMHSHHHRGQNAARLRELGGEPPTLDLIVWYWKGRPAARWD